MHVFTAMYWLVASLIWIAIAFWPARVAGRKGHSFIGFFILSLFFFPLSLILAYVVSNRNLQISGTPVTKTIT